MDWSGGFWERRYSAEPVPVGMWLTLLDTVAIFTPLTSFNGKRVWDWNRELWGLLAAASIALAFCLQGGVG